MAHYQQGRRQQVDEYGNLVPVSHGGIQGQQQGQAGGYGVAGTGSYDAGGYGGGQQAGYGPTGTGTHDAGDYGGSGYPRYGATGTGVHDAGGPGGYGATGTKAHGTHGGVAGFQDGGAVGHTGGMHGATDMGTHGTGTGHCATGMHDTGVLGGGGHTGTGMMPSHGTGHGATGITGTGGASPHGAEHKTGGILRRSGSSSSSSMDGGGCDIWKWEEDYEQWLVDNKHVPPSYQPVFQSTKMPQPEEQTKGDGGQLEQFKYLIGIAREIVFLLKCLILVYALVLVTNLYGIVKSG